MSCTREWKDCLMKVKGWEFSPLFTEHSPCRPPPLLCQDASHSLPAPSWHPPPPPPTQGRLSSRLCYLTSLASFSPSWEAGSQHHCPSFTDRATESFFYCYWTKVNQLEPVSHSKALEPDPSSCSWRRHGAKWHWRVKGMLASEQLGEKCISCGWIRNKD